MIKVHTIGLGGIYQRLYEVAVDIKPTVKKTMHRKEWDTLAKQTAKDALDAFFEDDFFEDKGAEKKAELMKTYLYEMLSFKNSFGFVLHLGKGILKEIEDLEEAAIAVDTPAVKKDDFRNELLNYLEDWVEEAKEKDTRDTKGSTTGRKPKSNREIAKGIYYIINPVNPTPDTKAAAQSLLDSQSDTGLGKFLEEQGFGGDRKEGESMSEMMQRIMMFKSADLSAFEEGDLDWFLRVVRSAWWRMLNEYIFKAVRDDLREEIKKIYAKV